MVSLGGSSKIGGFSGRGFGFNFERQMSPGMLDRVMHKEAVAIRSASIEAVVTTTNEVKLRIRAFINAHFTGSRWTSNNNRRIANAAAQSKFYDDLDNKGQYTGLVYSKFGAGMGSAGFVDFLLLHVRGGTVRPKTGSWLKIPNREAVGKSRFGGPNMAIGGQVGNYPLSGTSVFFAKSDDGQKMFLLRRLGRSGKGRKNQKTELLATLVKTLIFPARLSGIDEIARSRGDLFESNLSQALTARGVGE